MANGDNKHYTDFTNTELEEIKMLAQDVHDKTIRLSNIIRRVSGYHDAHIAFTHATAFQLLNVMVGCCPAMYSSSLALTEQMKSTKDNL